MSGLLVRINMHRLKDTGGSVCTVEYGTCRGDWNVEHYGIPQAAKARYQELCALAAFPVVTVEAGP